MASDTPHIPPGAVVLDKYRVVRTIGAGGMGVVVHAVHVTLGTPVAIKFLLPHFGASSDAARRFVREAQAASKITGDNIAKVVDVGTGPYGPYIVMEYLEGEDLSRALKLTGPLPLTTAIDYAVQAATALAEAHQHGIVHRDVKPANLFVVRRSDGASLLKVLDFGISKVAEETNMEVTKTTAILGSGLYMSPEQMKSSKNVDQRTDVYALGITLYELLARTQPYVADNLPDLVMRVAMEPPDPLRRHRPDVPEELARTIERAYARRADDRYPSMVEFMLALAPWAKPETRNRIDAIVRMAARAGRYGSSPSLPPPASLAPPGSIPPPAPALALEISTNAQEAYAARIPGPPSVPDAKSLGVDTFGLESKRNPLQQTSEKSFAATHGTRSRGLLGAGIGIGALLAAAAALFVYLRREPAPSPALAAAESAAAKPSEAPSAAPEVAPTTTASASAEALASASAEAVASAAPSASVAAVGVRPASGPTTPSATAPAATAEPTAEPTAAPTAEPPPPVTAAPTAAPPPCIPGLRTLDGQPCTP